MEEALLEMKEVVTYWTFVFFTFPTTVTSSDKMQLRGGRIYSSFWYDSAVPTRWGLYHSRGGSATMGDTGCWLMARC